MTSSRSIRIELLGQPRRWVMAVEVGRNFDPEDIVVKAVNHVVEVSAEKWKRDGSVEVNFRHRCQLPPRVDPTTVTSQLYRDGTLMLRADWSQETT